MESETKGRKVRALNKTYKNIKWTMTVIDEGKGRGLKGRRKGCKVQHFLDSYTIVCRACEKKNKEGWGDWGFETRAKLFTLTQSLQTGPSSHPGRRPNPPALSSPRG